MSKLGKKNETYYIEIDQQGCEFCGAGRTWKIVGPVAVPLRMSWSDEEEASDIAEMLNDAYMHTEGEK
jgi:hypothetical protein